MTHLIDRLIEDIIEGVMHGDVADSLDAVSIRRREDGAVEVDTGDARVVYLVTVRNILRT